MAMRVREIKKNGANETKQRMAEILHTLLYIDKCKILQLSEGEVVEFYLAVMT